MRRLRNGRVEHRQASSVRDRIKLKIQSGVIVAVGPIRGAPGLHDPVWAVEFEVLAFDVVAAGGHVAAHPGVGGGGVAGEIGVHFGDDEGVLDGLRRGREVCYLLDGAGRQGIFGRHLDLLQVCPCVDALTGAYGIAAAKVQENQIWVVTRDVGSSPLRTRAASAAVSRRRASMEVWE